MNLSQWKSVKDTFPPHRDDGWNNETDCVLIFDGRTVFIGYAMKYIKDMEEEETEWRWYLQGRDAYRIENITHWMELPKPPSQV